MPCAYNFAEPSPWVYPNIVRVDGQPVMRDVEAWLTGDDLRGECTSMHMMGKYRDSKKPHHFTLFGFSDPDTALLFKLRFG